MISLDLIHRPFFFFFFFTRLMQFALALDSGSACGVFPGQGEVGHAVPSVSAYNFTVCDDKAQLHRDKQARLLCGPNICSEQGLCRYATLLR